MTAETTGISLSRTTWWCISICGLLLLGLYVLMPYATGYGAERHSIAYWLWYFWRDPDWQHGALVLPILGVLLWRRRQKLFGGDDCAEGVEAREIRGSWWGLGVIGVALFAYFRVTERTSITLAIFRRSCWSLV